MWQGGIELRKAVHNVFKGVVVSMILRIQYTESIFGHVQIFVTTNTAVVYEFIITDLVIVLVVALGAKADCLICCRHLLYNALTFIFLFANQFFIHVGNDLKN
jgi:hypothetical protein